MADCKGIQWALASKLLEVVRASVGGLHSGKLSPLVPLAIHCGYSIKTHTDLMNNISILPLFLSQLA